MRLYYFALAGLLLLGGCVREKRNGPGNYNVDAWVPIYAQPGQAEIIGVEPAKATARAGKIYAWGNYIFQNDLYSGFHIVNNANPAAPQKVAFLKVPFSSEIAIKGNYLYTNNVSDLLVFDLSNPLSPSLVKRVKNAFPLINQSYPEVSNVYFECPDLSKGIVAGWEVKNIPVPNCRR